MMKKADLLRTVGRSIPRTDALEKLNGTARYAGDISFPDMLHLKVVRSDRPHARILNVRTEKALELPGIIAVLTHADIPGAKYVGPHVKDQPVLCVDTVRYVGDPICLVVAEKPELASKAASLVTIQYEDLPCLFSPEEALAPESIKIHEEGNVFFDQTLIKGDIEKGLAMSEVVITNTYRTPMAEHAYLEPEAGVARYDNGKITVWMPSKYIHQDHKEIAAVLGLEPEALRLINTTIGGCFGDKASLNPGYFAALASFKTRRPCKLVYSREESFIVTTKRHPFTIQYTTGATRDGRILAVKVESLADIGAYASYSRTVLLKAILHAVGPYDVDNVYVRARGVYTNNPICGAMRGLGVPQVTVAHESQIDQLAEALHMDPFEIRLRNAIRSGSLTSTGQRLESSIGLAETIEKVRAEVILKGTPPPSGSKRYGWGIASMIYGIGVPGRSNPGVARLEATESGDIILYQGCGDVGQGSNTVLNQIAAEILACDPADIKHIAGDTDLCPDSGVTAASRVTYIVGRAVQIAATKLRDMLVEAAASLIEIAPEDLVFENRTFYPKEAPHRALSLAEVTRELKKDGIIPVAEGRYDPEIVPLDSRTLQGAPTATYAFATQAALVCVDIDTGESEILCMVAAHDVGKAINPSATAGQIEGGICMGIGYALSEEIVLKDGFIQNPSFSEYSIPTVLDMPNVKALLVECEEPTGPFGAKGVGEPALVPTAPAIMNAIAAATGIRVKEIPVNSERLWRLMKQKKGH